MFYVKKITYGDILHIEVPLYIWINNKYWMKNDLFTFNNSYPIVMSTSHILSFIT